MIAITGTIGTGKTTELIKMSAENKGFYIVAPTKQGVEIIKKMAYKMELEIPEPFTFDQVLSGKHRGLKEVNGLLIDNLEWFLTGILGTPVVAVADNLIIKNMDRNKPSIKHLREGFWNE